MYSRREKIEHFDRLKGGEHAADDVQLLEQKMPSHPKLSRFKVVPHRYANDILYALLDVCTAEEIEKNRKPAAPVKNDGSSKASTKKDGSSKASTKKKTSEVHEVHNNNAPDAPDAPDAENAEKHKEKEPTTGDGSSETLSKDVDEVHEVHNNNAPDAPADEAKKK